MVKTIAGSTNEAINASRLLPKPPKLLALSSPRSIRKKVDRLNKPVMVNASIKEI